MINKLRALVLVGCMALAPAAFAIPFSISITNTGFGAEGSWSLTGPLPGGTTTGDSFDVPNFQTQSFSRDILAGSYSWGITGTGNFSLVTWVLRVNGDVVDGGAGIGGRNFVIDDSGRFAAVPEPGTLALLGLGLLGIGFSVRRRQTEV